ncbi:MAG: hypothetical protein LLF94_11355 [Chlamydiales bacterium]|nr:hypothetical protein [Chlamydiales bacterium]
MNALGRLSVLDNFAQFEHLVECALEDDPSFQVTDSETEDPLTELREFTALFKRPGKHTLPKPIQKLDTWVRENQDEMWVQKTSKGHLELAYNRPELINKLASKTDEFGKIVGYREGLRIVQNFERCLTSVTRKLIVLHTTHGSDKIKRIGFENPDSVFKK